MMKRRGFTLVELLVVISIIGLLIALLLPALASARVDAERAVCASNIRTLTQAIHIYANDFKGQYPWTTQGNWPFGGQSVMNGSSNVSSYPTDDFGSLYFNGILTNPASIYCPQSGYMGPSGPYANTSYTPRNGVSMGAAYLPTAVNLYIASSHNQNWRTNLIYYGVYSTYCYWWQRPNTNVFGPPNTTYGIWINPETQIGKRINYAIPNEDFTQSAISPGSTILVTDLTVSYDGSWDAGPFLGGADPNFPMSNHTAQTGAPDGANIGYNDGSVEWKPYTQMHVGYAFNYDFYR